MIEDYYKALDRLISNKPINVEKGTKINNDTVALEAGRKRGTIKKSRPAFDSLIKAIEQAQSEQNLPMEKLKLQKSKYKDDAEDYRQKYEDALKRELMYIEKINKLEKVIRKFKN